jgi:hypothetical protein
VIKPMLPNKPRGVQRVWREEQAPEDDFRRLLHEVAALRSPAVDAAARQGLR